MINDSFKLYPDASLNIKSLPLKVCAILLKNKKYNVLSLLIKMR